MPSKLFSSLIGARTALNTSVMSTRMMHRIKHRSEIADANTCRRVVVKLGSAVVCRPDEFGVALGRLAGVVEQVADLQRSGRQVVLVTSGAVAFGRQLLVQQNALSRSIRQTLKGNASSGIDPRACSAAGQGGLVALYQTMFQQYGIMSAQVLVTKNDFKDRKTLEHLRQTMNELMGIGVVPIINENDAVSPPGEEGADLDGVISVVDNDSLAANIATQMRADFMLLLSDVDGLYSGPPGKPGSRLMHRYMPDIANDVEFGAGSKVGRGGMQAKVGAAAWAWQKGVAVAIANGLRPGIISEVLAGKKVGTFFTDAESKSMDMEAVASDTRRAGRNLAVMPAAHRSDIVNRLADLLIERQDDILRANHKDISAAEGGKVTSAMINRLKLTPAKLESLATGLRQIAAGAEHHLGRVVKKTKVIYSMI